MVEDIYDQGVLPAQEQVPLPALQLRVLPRRFRPAASIQAHHHRHRRRRGASIVGCPNPAAERHHRSEAVEELRRTVRARRQLRPAAGADLIVLYVVIAAEAAPEPVGSVLHQRAARRVYLLLGVPHLTRARAGAHRSVSSVVVLADLANLLQAVFGREGGDGSTFIMFVLVS